MNTISKKEYEKLDAEKIFGNKKKDHIDKFAAGEITFDEFDEIEQKKRNKGGKKIKPRNDPANQNDVMKMFNFNNKFSNICKYKQQCENKRPTVNKSNQK